MNVEGELPELPWLVLLLPLEERLPREVGEVWPSVEELLLLLAAALVVELPSLVPRPFPPFQCCTQKRGKAWELMSRA